jgi:Ca2+-binding RTX toxin-like protein
MTVPLDTPNESFSNEANLVDADPIIQASSSNNVVTNTGVMWTTGVDFSAIELTEVSSNATVTNTATGYIRGGEAAVFVGGSATINNGGEMIGGEEGIDIFAPNAVVKANNLFGGTIKGGGVGISIAAGNGSEIANDGIIYGDRGVMLGHLTKLTNSGEVGGASAGVSARGDTTIVNKDFGTIWSSGKGIYVLKGEATITNDADSLITGVEKAILTGDGVPASSSRIALTNLGKIEGVIDCNASLGNVTDTIVNKGTITGRVDLGAGGDIFNGTGGSAAEVYGEMGNDVLLGSTHADDLSGGSGLDYLWGGLGRDEVFGGADRDIFDFNSIAESKVGSANRDQILHFQRGTDDIDLFDIDAKSGISGNNAFKFIGTQSFHGKKGELHYKDLGDKCLVRGDVNGDAKADFEILVKAGALSAGDFLL